MPRLEISLLGSFRASLAGRPLVAFESDKVRALLAYLAMEGEVPHRREQLAALLWPEQPEARAHASLSQALYNLRGLLGDRPGGKKLSQAQNNQPAIPFILVTPQSAQFNPASDYFLDVAAFSAIWEQCHRHAHTRLEGCEACQARLETAMSHYCGDFLADFSLGGCLAFEEWALVWRERLLRQALAALEQLAGSQARRGELDPALAYARRQAALDPLGEAGQRQVMRLLALQGHLQGALAQYAHCQQLLQAELGIAPSQETQALAQRLRAELAGNLPAVQLPAALTPFVGRQAERLELGGLLREPGCRLVTVLGPGGSGKTRLALEAARAARYDFADGVYLAPLSALGSADELAPAIAAALNLTFRAGVDPRSQLLDYLRGKHLLLVLDSFETALAAAGWLVELQRQAPGVSALVTSRARLNLQAERIFPLGGLRYPQGEQMGEARQYSAVQLFASGAERAHPGFRLAEAGLPDAARICQLVGGLPLGLLLAAAWVATYPLGEIADAIGRSLDFLSVDWQDVPERQRSLRATFEYSWRLLRPEERDALASMAVFRASFSRQAAGEVAGATALTLHRLVEKTMLQDAADGRYLMHDLLRQFATEKLQANEPKERAARDSHCRYYLAKLAAWREDLNGACQMAALAEMDAESADARAACLQAAASGNWQHPEKAVEGLCRFYGLRSRYAEGESACREMLDRYETPGAAAQPAPPPGWRAWLLAWQADFSRSLGKPAAAAQLLADAQASLAPGETEGCGQLARALAWYEGGLLEENMERSKDYLLTSLESFLQLNEPRWVASVLSNLGRVLNQSNYPVEALQASTRSLAIMRQLGDRRGIADSLMWLSIWHVTHGYFEQALVEMQEAAELYHALGDHLGAATGYRQLGIMLGWNGRFAESAELIERSLLVFRELGELFGLAFSTLSLSSARLFQGNYPAAICLGYEALPFFRAGGFLREEAAGLLSIGCANLSLDNAAAGLQLLEESVELYRKIDYVDELGWALGGTSLAYLCLGQMQPAQEQLCAALRIVLEVKGTITLISGLPALTRLLLEKGQVEQAVEVCALVRRRPCIYNSTWFEDIAGHKVDDRAAELPLAVRERAEQRGRECDPYALLAELLEALGCPG